MTYYRIELRLGPTGRRQTRYAKGIDDATLTALSLAISHLRPHKALGWNVTREILERIGSAKPDYWQHLPYGATVCVTGISWLHYICGL